MEIRIVLCRAGEEDEAEPPKSSFRGHTILTMISSSPLAPPKDVQIVITNHLGGFFGAARGAQPRIDRAPKRLECNYRFARGCDLLRLVVRFSSRTSTTRESVRSAISITMSLGFICSFPFDFADAQPRHRITSRVALVISGRFHVPKTAKALRTAERAGGVDLVKMALLDAVQICSRKLRIEAGESTSGPNPKTSGLSSRPDDIGIPTVRSLYREGSPTTRQCISFR